MEERTNVNVGSTPLAPTASTVGNINGMVNFAVAPDGSMMTVADGGDTSEHNVSIANDAITGLARATIYFGLADVYIQDDTATPESIGGSVTILPDQFGRSPSDLYDVGLSSGGIDVAWDGVYFSSSQVTVVGLTPGTGSPTIDVEGVPAFATLDIVGQDGPSNVVVGSEPFLASTSVLAKIQGEIEFQEATGSTMTLDDAGDTSPHNNVTISDGTITGLAPVPIYFGYAALSIYGGTVNNTFTMSLGASSNFSYGSNVDYYLQCGTGSNYVNVLSTSLTICSRSPRQAEARTKSWWARTSRRYRRVDGEHRGPDQYFQSRR